MRNQHRFKIQTFGHLTYRFLQLQRPLLQQKQRRQQLQARPPLRPVFQQLLLAVALVSTILTDA